MNKLRKTISLTTLLSSLAVLLTSVILYLVPQGRVAYWADWRLWGMTKTQWTNLHINLGLLFVAAAVLHIYLNWKPIVAYMKTKSKTLRIFTRDFNMALAVTVVVGLGTFWDLPPFSTVIAVSDAIKDKAAETYGEPPYGHAELSTLKTFASRMGWHLDQSLERLAEKDIVPENTEITLKELAEKHGITPQQLYLAMKPQETNTALKKLPDNPPPGIGRRTLADICQDYQLAIPALMRGLAEQGKTASADMTLKELAERHDMAPADAYTLFKRIADSLTER